MSVVYWNQKMRDKIIEALCKKYKGVIAEAETNIEVYLENPVGIGEHPDVLAAIDSQLAIAADAKEKLECIREFYLGQYD